MIYIIYENGKEINRIIADEDFCKKYCDEMDYEYEPFEELVHQSLTLM